MFGRSSRLILDKIELGFRYPCDGPGRGGTCQVYGFDHTFLALYWMYNTISVVCFHYVWKLQSDLWAIVKFNLPSLNFVDHITGSDFNSNAHTINRWLRSLLWSQFSQVIQPYGTPLSAYSLIFLGTYFVWAFSLMFRGYWQELLERVVWAGTKLKIVIILQPRALSISQGRAVGMADYICGGISCSWAC